MCRNEEGAEPFCHFMLSIQLSGLPDVIRVSVLIFGESPKECFAERAIRGPPAPLGLFSVMGFAMMPGKAQYPLLEPLISLL